MHPKNNKSFSLKDIAFESIYYGIDCVSASSSLKRRCVIEDGVLKIGSDTYYVSEFDRVFLFSFGKVACEMAKFFVERLDIYKAIIASNKRCEYNYQDYIDFFLSSHPIPNENSLKAADRLLEISEEIKETDLVIFLISGGASSIIERPSIDFELYKRILVNLLNGEYSINMTNTIREALSEIKGGKILRKIKGKIISFVISDVVGDDLSVIGSALTYFSKLDEKRVNSVLKELGFEVSWKNDVVTSEEFEEMKVKNYIVASNSVMCKCMVDFLRNRGFNVLYLGSRVAGNIECVASFIASVAFATYEDNLMNRPLAIVFGGETYLRITRDGCGGRNQHLVLEVLNKVKDIKDFLFLSFATDGKDGNSNYAGAWIDEFVYDEIKRNNINLHYFLDNFNSALFFEELGRNIMSFNTETNVSDVGMLLFG